MSIGGKVRHHGSIRNLALVVFLASSIGGAWWLHKDGLLSPGVFLHGMALHPLASAGVFAVSYVLSVLALLPTLPADFVAGALWGPLLGGLVAAGSTLVGTTVAFLVARKLFGQPLARRLRGRRLTRLQQEFDAQGWQFVALIRLNPLLPAGLLNYLLGLTSMGVLTYVWATALFLLPQVFITALIGYEMGGVMTKGGNIDLIKGFIAMSGVSLLAVVMWYLARKFNLARRSHENGDLAALDLPEEPLDKLLALREPSVDVPNLPSVGLQRKRANKEIAARPPEDNTISKASAGRRLLQVLAGQLMAAPTKRVQDCGINA